MEKSIEGKDSIYTCGKCGKPTTNKPLTIPNRNDDGSRAEGFKKIVRCTSCIRNGLKEVINAIAGVAEKGKTEENKSEPAFVHSKCCDAHWECVCRDGIWGLECEKCGKPIGGGITIIGPNISGCECAECKKKLGGKG